MNKKVVIIGLDGVPHSLLEQFTQQGIMPHFREIMSKGFLRKMETSLPEVSSVAWTSFMTGKNPGEHGIFGFMELKDSSYDMHFPNYTDVKCPDVLGKHGCPFGRIEYSADLSCQALQRRDDQRFRGT